MFYKVHETNDPVLQREEERQQYCGGSAGGGGGGAHILWPYLKKQSSGKMLWKEEWSIVDQEADEECKGWMDSIISWLDKSSKAGRELLHLIGKTFIIVLSVCSKYMMHNCDDPREVKCKVDLGEI